MKVAFLKSQWWRGRFSFLWSLKGNWNSAWLSKNKQMCRKEQNKQMDKQNGPCVVDQDQPEQNARHQRETLPPLVPDSFFLLTHYVVSLHHRSGSFLLFKLTDKIVSALRVNSWSGTSSHTTFKVTHVILTSDSRWSHFIRCFRAQRWAVCVFVWIHWSVLVEVHLLKYCT